MWLTVEAPALYLVPGLHYIAKHRTTGPIRGTFINPPLLTVPTHTD